MRTAAVVIIGDEILSGKFSDENGPFLTRRLRELGVALKRLVVVSDEPAEIAEEVRRCSERYDLVFTTGGVGPTHDDVTMVSIALGLDAPLEQREELVELLRERGVELNEAALRMTRVPRGADLITSDRLRFPLVAVRNVYIFPGVPAYLQAKFDAIADRWQDTPLSTARVVTGEREVAIAARLEAAAERWPTVAIGSYPRFEEVPPLVIVTMEGGVAEDVEACRAWLAAQLRPPGD